MSAKIYGPYRRAAGWACYLKTTAGARRWCPVAETEQQATDEANEALEAFRSTAELTVGDLCDRYVAHLRDLERKESTLTAVRNALRRILELDYGRLAGSISPAMAKARYHDLTAAGFAAATHRESLKTVRTTWAWGMEESLVKTNPWQAVKPIGRPRRGKAQLTLDESRRLMETCLRHAIADDGAVAVLLALVCGLRVSEIHSRIVRDVDNDCSTLRITVSKTDMGRRDPQIPEVLQPAILVRVTNRGPEELLFAAAAERRGRNHWVADQVEKFCQLAAVPKVCPHALRGGLATLSYEAGALPHLVAALLGHASSKTTEKHYAKAEAVQAAEQARRLRHLRPV